MMNEGGLSGIGHSPLRIGLVINNVLRDYIGKLIEVYEKYTGNQPIEPINPYQLELAFPLSNDEFTDIYQWMYYGVSLEIFGAANQTRTNLLSRISTLQTKIEDQFVVLSRETTRSKYATLSFLSKAQFDLSEIIFVNNYADYWKYVDVVITDNPEILKVMPPKDKAMVVLKNDYNKEFHGADYTIDSPDGIFTLPFLHFKPIKPEELVHVTGQMMNDEGIIMDNPEELMVEGAAPVKVDEAAVTIIDGVPQLIDLTEIRANVDQNANTAETPAV
jgi:hypothetical protein